MSKLYYNGDIDSNQNIIYDHYSLVIGDVFLRQSRIKNGNKNQIDIFDF